MHFAMERHVSYRADHMGIRPTRGLNWMYFEFDKEPGPRTFAGKNMVLHTGRVGFRLK